MSRARTIQTGKGTATLNYDESAGMWSVAVWPSNSGRPRDRFAVEAWRDEAGFRGRDWRVEGPGASSMPSDQFASLKEVAEEAIALAFNRVVTADIMDGAPRHPSPERIAYDAGWRSSSRTLTCDLDAAESRFITRHGYGYGGTYFAAGWVDYAADNPKYAALDRERGSRA
jgi:hypothetical protein